MGRVFLAAMVIGGSVLSSISFGYSGGSGTAENPYKIANPNDLLLLAADANDYNDCFILINDINLGGYSFTRAVIAPEGSQPFTGIFDGNGHSIFSLTIDANNSGTDYLSLFGQISKATIKNLGIKDVNIIGRNGYCNTGALGGINWGGYINNCYAAGNITGHYNPTGGLCGVNDGNISNCYAACVINGETQTGGLCGLNNGNIINCYSTGTVTVNGASFTGGLCGVNLEGTISNCYSTGNVSGNNWTGGLCGLNTIDGSIINCYSTGTVTGDDYIGGLCGQNYSSITSCYFLDTTGPDNGYGEPLTDEQMKQQGSFVGWDFVGETTNGTGDIWRMCIDGVNYPLLWWQFNTADFTCPDGVNIEDLDYFVQRWLLGDCASSNNCDGADMNGSGAVDFADFAIFAQHWLQQN